MPPKKDLTGMKFGRLKVLGFAERRNKKAHFHCICDCGNEKVIRGDGLTTGHAKSCGCLNKEVNRKQKNTLIHGESKTRLHNIWWGIIRRCEDEKDQAYENYGGRGIKVDKTWRESYLSFKKWAMENGYKKDLTIERINNDGNYEPENCSWVPKSEQSGNRRCLHWLECQGEKHYIAEWSRILGIPEGTIYRRLKKGWPVEEVLRKSGS